MEKGKKVMLTTVMVVVLALCLTLVSLTRAQNLTLRPEGVTGNYKVFDEAGQYQGRLRKSAVTGHYRVYDRNGDYKGLWKPAPLPGRYREYGPGGNYRGQWRQYPLPPPGGSGLQFPNLGDIAAPLQMFQPRR